MAAAPVAVSLRAGSTSGEDILFKDPGFSTAAPKVWGTMQGRPDFTAAKLLRDPTRGCTPGSRALDLDAISVGLDEVWADATGKVLVPPNRWGALMLTVGKGSGGVPGSVIAQEATRRDTKQGVGADVFTYTLLGSKLPAAWSGVTHRALDASEISLSQLDEIDALDAHLPLYALDSLVYNQIPTFGNPPTVYFSLSSATAAAAPASWWGGTIPSGATILSSAWNPSALRWNCPGVFVSYQQLRLKSTDDLTALAVDRSRGFLLFSSNAANRADPIMFFDYQTVGAAPQIYRYPSSNDDEQPVSKAAGTLQSDSIEAVCALDPTYTALSSGSTIVGQYAYGTPWEAMYCSPPLPFSRLLSASTFRHVAGGLPRLESHMLGWPLSGIGPGTALALLWLHDPLALPCAPYSPATLLLAQAYPRNPASPICGAPEKLVIGLPVVAAPPLTGVLVQWLAVGATAQFSDIATAFPVVLSLP